MYVSIMGSQIRLSTRCSSAPGGIQSRQHHGDHARRQEKVESNTLHDNENHAKDAVINVQNGEQKSTEVFFKGKTLHIAWI